MVGPVPGEAEARHDLVVQTRQSGGLVVVGAHVEDLQRPALVQGELLESGDGQLRLLARRLRQPLGDVLRGDRLGQGDHHGPVPLPLVTGDEGRIVGARPQSLQGADDEVIAGSFLQHDADRVGARVERLDRGGVGR